MTVTPGELGLYAGALLVLFLTPGPVWVALTARALSGGVRAAWPLALGVVVGDVLWPLVAILGVSWAVSAVDGALVALRYLASLVFLGMGLLLIRHADDAIPADSRLTRPGMWAGFVAGLAAILGNPKAILFYIGILPGFFDLAQVGAADIAAIVTVSAAVPLVGNIVLALGVDRARRILTAPAALRRTNQVAGALLILVGLGLAVT